ncbi:uncharacterized protein IL334_004380 [Kwoniella shivajii]|uniref:Uncharacterized protein n=1 Tax=Kwoniella shivajii TaxID=564305 RepID=A0ABZ1D1I7_9TREE|nr:hypothetical protein IL334_004380 [Kwoniella shivajii]
MSGLQLTSLPSTSPSMFKTSLPSFDDLLKSLEEPSISLPHVLQHHSPHYHPHHYQHHYHHVQPYPSPHHHPRHISRPPSTPPTPRPSSSDDNSYSHPKYDSKGHGRPRSSSVPSTSRTHLQSPFRDLHILSQPSIAHIDHHTNRVQCLKEGDGEWAPYSLNAVTPSSLPYHARPHFHPRFSTGDTSDDQPLPFSLKYKRASDSELNDGIDLEHVRKYQCTGQRQQRYDQNINSNPSTGSQSSERIWHFIGEKGCHLQLHQQQRSALTYARRSERGSLVAEDFLMHIMVLGDKRASSMM